MILVDTSVSIDHLRTSDDLLVGRLEADDVGCHPYVIEELALGSIAARGAVLDLLGSLYDFPLLSHADVMSLISLRQLWARGLGAVDVHLLAATLVVPGSTLWTRDRRLAGVCAELGVRHVDVA